MKKIITRFLSVFLALLLIVGGLTTLLTVDMFAAGTTTDSSEETKTDWTEVDFTKKLYNTPQEKLATMDCYLTKGDFSLYLHEYTGELALYDNRTGETIFSNPYDIGASVGSEATKKEILSQILVRFTDTSGSRKTFTSYEEAALRQQIKIERTKNGLRVEYILGDENSRRLVPRMITKVSFETNVLNPIAKAIVGGEDNFWYQKLKNWYVLYDLENMSSETYREEALKRFPILEQVTALYVFDTKNATTRALNDCENTIKTYAPEYTYEQMEADHAEVGYDSSQDVSPVFKMALEYSLNDDGLTVRLPANGIRFNSSLYTLESISVLPYFGSGNSKNEGYTFYPDGSGTLFDFDTDKTIQTASIRNPLYGTDYAYTTITGKYQRPLRYAVFGAREVERYFNYVADVITTNTDGTQTVSQENRSYSSTVTTLAAVEKMIANDSSQRLVSDGIEEVSRTRGFFAIVEEGETMAEIATYHAGKTSNYNAIMTYFQPRPKDTYKLQDSIAVNSANKEWTIVSNRKYSGNFVIRYIMLHDEETIAAENLSNAYAADYNGMAFAYRDYLLNKGILTRLTDSDVKQNIPLFIRTFGAVDTTEQILSFPVNVKKALTSFNDIISMYEDLQEAGIKNVQFQMDGYINGGMFSTVPYRLSWVRSVGGASGYRKLLAYANQVNTGDSEASMGIYPDFDFVWVRSRGLFDGINLKRDIIRGINDRYKMLRDYSPLYQVYVSRGELGISPAYFSRFYTKLVSKYLKTGSTNISISTLGQYLNADFDTDEPYNRNDNKNFTEEAFKYFDENFDSVMTSGGNSFTWKYVDYIVDAPMSSSKYIRASREVPFFGMVLHGYLQFAGAPANMEGSSYQSVLKAIESGGSLFYILSYRNTEVLKNSYLNKYYSVNYEIWKDDLKQAYLTANAVLKDVQTKLILKHEFLQGSRVPDNDELMADILAMFQGGYTGEQIEVENAKFNAIKAVNDAREAALTADEKTSAILTTLNSAAESIGPLVNRITSLGLTYQARKTAYDTAVASGNKTQINNTRNQMNQAKNNLTNQIKTVLTEIKKAQAYEPLIAKYLKDATDAVATVSGVKDVITEIVSEVNAHLSNVEGDQTPIANDFAALNELEQNAYNTSYEYGITEDDIAIILASISVPSVGENTDVSEEEEENTETFDKYAADSSKVVAVTYGGKNGDDSKAYKTIILNYNGYNVMVEYQGVIYNIPSGQFIVLNW